MVVNLSRRGFLGGLLVGCVAGVAPALRRAADVLERADFITLADWARRMDAGQTERIATLLSEGNDLLDDLPWVEGNVTYRTKIAAETWRAYRFGLGRSAATSFKVNA